MFEPITEFEELPKSMAVKICQAGWPAITGEVDIAFGAGKIDKSTKAIWTKDGKRIIVSMGGGAMTIAQSKDPDPLYAERKAALAK